MCVIYFLLLFTNKFIIWPVLSSTKVQLNLVSALGVKSNFLNNLGKTKNKKTGIL